MNEFLKMNTQKKGRKQMEKTKNEEIITITKTIEQYKYINRASVLVFMFDFIYIFTKIEDL